MIFPRFSRPEKIFEIFFSKNRVDIGWGWSRCYKNALIFGFGQVAGPEISRKGGPGSQNICVLKGGMLDNSDICISLKNGYWRTGPSQAPFRTAKNKAARSCDVKGRKKVWVLYFWRRLIKIRCRRRLGWKHRLGNLPENPEVPCWKPAKTGKFLLKRVFFL